MAGGTPYAQPVVDLVECLLFCQLDVQPGVIQGFLCIQPDLGVLAKQASYDVLGLFGDLGPRLIIHIKLAVLYELEHLLLATKVS